MLHINKEKRLKSYPIYTPFKQLHEKSLASYDVECIVKNSLSNSLFSNKKSIKRLFNDLLREKKDLNII